MKKQGIDRSTDLDYSNSRSRELRPDQSANFRINVPALLRHRASRLISRLFGQQLYSTAALGSWGGFFFLVRLVPTLDENRLLANWLMEAQANPKPPINYISLAARQLEAERNLAGEINGSGV